MAIRSAAGRRKPPGKKKTSESRSERNARWVQRFCRIPEGRFVGNQLVLAPYMAEDFRQIYDNPAGTRRAIISRARKNAKTFEAAIIVLLHLCGPEHRPNSNLYSAAQSRDQAALLFALAAKIVRMSQDLSDVIQIRDTAKQLLCPMLGTQYRALSAEATTAYGLSPALIVHDELGQVRGPRSELYEALETATAAQEAPLSIVISTQAPTDADLLSILIDDATAAHDPRVVLRLDTVPEDADPFSEDSIRLANPAFDYFLNRDEVMAMARDAERMPARESEYRNLILNQRVDATSPFVSPSLWKSCGDAPKSIDKVRVYGGLDLSSVKDLTALVLIGNVGGVWQVHPSFWLPSEGLTDKARSDRVPYDVWAREGHLLLAPGKSVDYSFVASCLRKLFDSHKIDKIAFDIWNFKHLKPWLLMSGFTEKMIEDHFVEFGQGFKSMSPALRDLEAEMLNKRIAHGNHPIMTMCAVNSVVTTDAAGNRKLAKDKSSGSIDGMVALAMALGAVPATVPERVPEFQMMVL